MYILFHVPDCFSVLGLMRVEKGFNFTRMLGRVIRALRCLYVVVTSGDQGFRPACRGGVGGGLRYPFPLFVLAFLIYSHEHFLNHPLPLLFSLFLI